MSRISKSKKKEKRKQQRYNKRTLKHLHLSAQPSEQYFPEQPTPTPSSGLLTAAQPGSSSSLNQSAAAYI